MLEVLVTTNLVSNLQPSLLPLLHCVLQTFTIKFHPGNVISHTLYFPARQRWPHHCKICFSAGTWEGSSDVSLTSSRVCDTQNLIWERNPITGECTNSGKKMVQEIEERGSSAGESVQWAESSSLTSICSANQPSSLAIREAMRRAKHFFPKREFPPYPLPKETISRLSGTWAMSVFSGLQGHEFTRGAVQKTLRDRFSYCICILQSEISYTVKPFLPFRGSGCPKECKHFTKSPSPSASKTGVPIRVMIRILATTYGESVS